MKDGLLAVVVVAVVVAVVVVVVVVVVSPFFCFDRRFRFGFVFLNEKKTERGCPFLRLETRQDSTLQSKTHENLIRLVATR